MLKYMIEGGTTMWLLLGLSILSVGAILDRWKVFKVADVEPADMRKQLLDLLTDGKPDEAEKLCEETKGPFAAVLLTGLRRYQALKAIRASAEHLEDGVARTMTEYSPRIIDALRKRLGLLLMVGGVAPALGLAGTAARTMGTLSTVAAAESCDAVAVVQGVSQALAVTVAGMWVGAIALAAWAVYAGEVALCKKRIDESIVALTECVRRQAASGAEKIVAQGGALE